MEVLELKQLIWDLSDCIVAQVAMKMRNVNEKCYCENELQFSEIREKFD